LQPFELLVISVALASVSRAIFVRTLTKSLKSGSFFRENASKCAGNTVALHSLLILPKDKREKASSG